jgi:carbamoyltransferase
MIIYGVSANEHDAGVAVVRGEEILFASTAERYSRTKNDPHLNAALLNAARAFGEPDLVVWYEKPFLKRTRRLFAGELDRVLQVDGKAYLAQFDLGAPIRYVGHHESMPPQGSSRVPSTMQPS